MGRHARMRVSWSTGSPATFGCLGRVVDRGRMPFLGQRCGECDRRDRQGPVDRLGDVRDVYRVSDETRGFGVSRYPHASVWHTGFLLRREWLVMGLLWRVISRDLHWSLEMSTIFLSQTTRARRITSGLYAGNVCRLFIQHRQWKFPSRSLELGRETRAQSRD